MAQISSLTARPDSGAVLAGKLPGFKRPPLRATSDTAEASSLQSQLTRLAGVLNGFRSNAASSRAQFAQTINKIRSGAYQVIPSEVSHSIVNDMFPR